jgi:DNA (cytosine-5)-methyltransferase 1
VVADSSNTLNNFDLGDTRTTHAVVYENHPSDSRVTGPLDVAPTVVSRFGTGGGNVPLVNQEPVTFQPGNLRREAGADPSSEATTTLKASSGDQMPHVAYIEPAVPLDGMNLLSRLGEASSNHSLQNFTPGDPQFTLTKGHHHEVITPMAVRRLTARECERLQGFPDDYSMIPWKGKPASECPDGPRYKACGNSFAVPVVLWIGERIQKYVDGTLNK